MRSHLKNKDEAYVLGDYGYYVIELTSTIDPASGAKTFSYEYHLYSDADEMPEAVAAMFTSEQLEDRLKDVNAIPQDRPVNDPVTLTIDTGGEKGTSLTLNATVKGSNDIPVIEKVEQVDEDVAGNYTPLELVNEETDEPNSMWLESTDEGRVLHILLESNSASEGESFLIGKITGSDPDSAYDKFTDGTTIESYSFVQTSIKGSTQVWSISADGTEASSKYGHISIDGEGYFRIHLYQDAGVALAQGEVTKDDIFKGLAVRCQDDEKATSELVNLSGHLVGVDDAATATDSHAHIWEGTHNYDSSLSDNPVPEDADLVESNELAYGTITVTDFDESDSISSITVYVDETTYTLNFDIDDGNTVQGERGTFYFIFNKDKGELTYTYKVNEDQLETIDELNSGQLYTLEDNIRVEFTSQTEDGVKLEEKASSSITVTVHGTNDAPVIQTVSTQAESVSAVDEPISWGTVAYNGQAHGKITTNDVDNTSSELFYGILTYKGDIVYGQTEDDGKTHYYKVTETGSEELTGITFEQLTFSKSVELEHGTIQVFDDGSYTFSRKPDDNVSNTEIETVYITVWDPHGAMDHVQIDFSLAPGEEDGFWPDVTLKNDVTLDVIEPSLEGDRVHAGYDDSVASSFDEDIAEGSDGSYRLTLEVRYWKDSDNVCHALSKNENGQWVASDGTDLPENPTISTAVGILVPKADGGYEWKYYDNNDTNYEKALDLSVPLEIRLSFEGEGWGDASYSLDADYGTVYVDQRTGELRFVVDSRADVLNAGEDWSKNVIVWINGKAQDKKLILEVTGTGDPSEIEAPALAVDLDKEDLFDQQELVIKDIDNSDRGDKSDTHSLFVGTVDDTAKPIAVASDTTLYVLSEDNGKTVTWVTDKPAEDSETPCYGELTFTVDEDGFFHYAFTAYDNDATKAIKEGDKLSLKVPVFVQDDSSAWQNDQEGGNLYNDLTTTPGEIEIVLTGKADKAKVQQGEVTIYEEGLVPEGQGESGGEHSHAVNGKLEIVDYDKEGYTLSGMSGEHTETDFVGGSTVVRGDFGTLVLNRDGSYTYTLDYDRVQYLAAEAEEEDVFTVAVTTAAGETSYTTIKVKVHGENDLPTVSVTPSVSVQEGAGGTATGHIEAYDIDQYDSLSFGIQVDEDEYQTASGESPAIAYISGVRNESGDLVLSLVDTRPDDANFVGMLTVQQDGTYSFALEDTDIVHGLQVGESTELDVQIGAYDGHDWVTKPVTITIHGSNDAPKITSSINVLEDDVVGQSNTLTIAPGNYGYEVSDADFGSSLTYTLERDGEYVTTETTSIELDGRSYEVTFSIDKDGAITVSYGNDLRQLFDSLGAQDTLILVPKDLNIVAIDDAGAKTPSPLTLTVQGTNDAPLIDDTSSTVGHLTFTDVDASDSHTLTFKGLYDVNGQELTFETTGIPESSIAVSDGGKELGTLSFSWQTDETTGRNTLTYTFNPAKKYLDSLPVEEDVTIPFSVTVTDPHGATDTSEELKFTVVNENDAPVLVEAQSDNNEENEGTIVFTDADLLDSHAVVFDGLGENGQPLVFNLADDESSLTVFYNNIAVGTLTVTCISDENMNTVHYSFVPTTDENVLNQLPLGDINLQFSASIRDAQSELSSSIDNTLVVTNDNNEPSIEHTFAEETLSGTLTITDPDVRDTHIISVLFDNNSYALGEDNTITIDGLGTFTFTQEGKFWRYSLDASDIAAGIPEGEQADKSFQIQVSDTGNGIATSGEIHVTVEGTNMAPTAESPESAVKIEQLGHAVSLELAALASDADGDELTLTITDMDNGQVTGKYGTLSYDAETGSYSYALDTSEENLAALGAAQEDGQSLTESFDYTVSDGVNESVPGSITLNLDLSGLELPLPVEPEETPGEGETTIPDPSEGGDSSETADADAGEDFEAIVYSIENGEALLFARDTYSLADGEEMYSLSPDEPEENTVDIVAYDSTDYMVDGGEGVSFMVSENEDLTMDDILQGDGQNGPIVSNIDVLITGEGAESLTNMDQLARDYGISVDRDANSLTLDESWQKVDSGHTDTQVFSNGSLTLETSLDVSCPSDDLNVQAAMHQVTNN